MPWSPEQLAKMVDDYWQHGRITCPSCRAIVSPHFHAADTGEYILIGSCPRGHGEMHLNRSHDPLAFRFRPWTDAEKKQMVDAQVEGRGVRCPVDGSAVKMTVHPTDAGMPIIMGQCYRCGNFLDPSSPT